MANGDDIPGNDDRPGYRKPPREHQFPPGRSGNPSGRPLKRKSDEELFRETAKMRVVISENGRRRSIPSDKAVYLTLRRAALKGEAWAIKEWMRLAREHGSHTAKESLADMFAEDERLLADFREQFRSDPQPEDDHNAA